MQCPDFSLPFMLVTLLITEGILPAKISHLSLEPQRANPSACRQKRELQEKLHRKRLEKKAAQGGPSTALGLKYINHQLLTVLHCGQQDLHEMQRELSQGHLWSTLCANDFKWLQSVPHSKVHISKTSAHNSHLKPFLCRKQFCFSNHSVCRKQL